MAEDDGQHHHHEHQDARAEGQQITFYETQHIGGDHGDAPQEQPAPVPVVVDDLPHLRHQRAASRVEFAGVVLELALGQPQLRPLLRSQAALLRHGAQGFAALQQPEIALIPLQIDLYGGGPAVGTDQQLAVNGAAGKLPAHQFPVDPGVRQRRQAPAGGHVGQ